MLHFDGHRFETTSRFVYLFITALQKSHSAQWKDYKHSYQEKKTGGLEKVGWFTKSNIYFNVLGLMVCEPYA